MGNMEYFELCETSTKVQCSQCLKCFRQLIDSKLHHQEGYFRGDRHGNSEMQKKHYQAEESLRKARKHKVTSILHRFQESETDRASQLEHNCDEKHCKELEKFALENHSHLATPEERKRHENTWVLTLNCQGQVEPKRQRADHPDANKRFQELRTQEGDGTACSPQLHAEK